MAATQAIVLACRAGSVLLDPDAAAGVAMPVDGNRYGVVALRVVVPVAAASGQLAGQCQQGAAGNEAFHQSSPDQGEP